MVSLFHTPQVKESVTERPIYEHTGESASFVVHLQNIVVSPWQTHVTNIRRRRIIMTESSVSVGFS